MKIRTKLLLALAGISLIPPIAAYFALINNPRISFALGMNKYEAQQGLTAQKLQADLQAIGSAVQESLNETYRIKVEPKERTDAERQRRLANSAVQSGVLAFEKALDTITQSVGQQARETSAAGESPDAVDQRETELLNDLRASQAQKSSPNYRIPFPQQKENLSKRFLSPMWKKNLAEFPKE